MANRTTRDFAEVIGAKLAGNPKLAEAVENEAFSADIAQKVYDLRKEAGLTQQQLASLIQTTQSVISRIEDADYDGHALALLKRIAFALGKKLRVEFYAVNNVNPKGGQDRRATKKRVYH